MDISFGEPIMLACAEPVQGFAALDRPLRCVGCPTPQPRVHLAFHQSMILLRHIIQILALSEKASLGEGSAKLLLSSANYLRHHDFVSSHHDRWSPPRMNMG
jgi:hypothetical protein